MTNPIKIFAALFGLLAASVFVGSFLGVGMLNPDFSLSSDYISKLGTHGQPYAGYWNLVGFGAVGVALAAFGWLFGLCRGDRVLGGCLVVAGVGFAFAAVPTDFSAPDARLSAIHYASVCFALAGWCLGLARLTGAGGATDDFARTTAYYAVTLALVPMICVGGGVSAEPVAHRIVLAVVFAWVVMHSVRLLKADLRPVGETR